MGQWWITVLGTAAGLCTVGSFVPQVVKAWREGDTNAISLRMYLVLVAGFVVWLGYGLLIGSWPIMLVNVANLVLSAAILWLKLRDSKGAGPAAFPAWPDARLDRTTRKGPPLAGRPFR